MACINCTDSEIADFEWIEEGNGYRDFNDTGMSRQIQDS
jgi:hypothetical protein